MDFHVSPKVVMFDQLRADMTLGIHFFVVLTHVGIHMGL